MLQFLWDQNIVYKKKKKQFAGVFREVSLQDFEKAP